MTTPPDPKTKTPRTTELCQSIGKRGIDWHHSATLVSEHARTLELENQSLTRRLEEAEKQFKEDQKLIGRIKNERQEKIAEAANYRQQLTEAEKELDAYRSEVVSVINHLPSNCIVHVTDLPAQESDCATLAVSVAKLAAKLTALRTAAEGALAGFAQALRQWKAYHDGTFEQTVDDADLEDASHLEGQFYQSATAALAALRAELDQADSNASNSPTASRESQG